MLTSGLAWSFSNLVVSSPEKSECSLNQALQDGLNCDPQCRVLYTPSCAIRDPNEGNIQGTTRVTC